MNASTKTRTPEQKAKHNERERVRRAAKKGPATIREAIAEREAAKAEWQTIEIDGKSVKVAASLSPVDAEKAARKLLDSKADLDAEKAEAKQAKRQAAASKKKVQRKSERAQRLANPEKPAPGANSVVNGRAGRWVRVGDARKWAHVPLHTLWARTLDGKKYTSAEGTTEVLCDGKPFSAPKR